MLIHPIHPFVGLMGYELFCDIPFTEVLDRFDLLEPDEIVVQMSCHDTFGADDERPEARVQEVYD